MAVRDTVCRKLTYEDYVLLPEDGKRHEILDGEHYATPASSLDHQGFYWLVDPIRRAVRVLRRSGAGFLAAQEVSAAAGDVLSTPLLPGFEIRVSEIFE